VPLSPFRNRVPARPRDNQRARLYRAEHEAFGVPPHSAWPCLTLPAVRHYVYDVLAAVWFRDEFGIFPEVRIKDGRGTRHAYSAYDLERHSVLFSFPRWARSTPVLLHEIGHAASLHRYGMVAAHGPEFAAVYLRLVQHYLGIGAHTRLNAAFMKHRVRH